jgi:signal transduction histidine kinase
VIANDITEKRRADARARQLVDALVNAEQAERERIARELHDDTSQSLASLLLELRSVEAAPSLEIAQAAAIELRARVSRTLDGVRRLARGLRPAALVGIGLDLALRRLADEVSQLHGIRVDVAAHAEHVSDLSSPVEIALYRIAQEALANAVRHAGATAVSLVLCRTADELRMIVEDDGRGFDVSSTETDEHLGLIGIRDRTQLLGGELTVDSAPGFGSTLCVAIPIRGGK